MIINYSRDRLLSEFSFKTLEDRYLVDGETSPQEAFARAAKAFASNDEHAQRLYDYASQLWFMFSTPILSNGGTERGLPISCFLSRVEDSRHGITGHYTENAFLSSVGGGIGGYWGDVRSVGSKTSKGSESTGVIPFMKVVDAEMLAFSQGITRRGSYAAYLDISHPEIQEFLDIRKPTGGDVNRKSINLHHAVVISDDFMRIIENATRIEGYDDSWDLIDPHSGEVKNTVSAKALWIKIIQNRVETGEPYVMFGDTVQAALPDFQKELGLEVVQSNLCVAPETEILTDKGYFPISDLENEEVSVWNGEEFTKTTIRKTGTDQKLLKISFSNGLELECTPYHKFYIKNSYRGKETQVSAKDLMIGDKLIKIPSLPIINGDLEDPTAYANGFFSADGCNTRYKDKMYFYADKKPIAYYCANILGETVKEEESRNYLHTDKLKDKFWVPLNGTVETKISWLAGYIDGDGTLTSNKDTQSIQISSTNMAFLIDVLKLLQTIGINSKIRTMHEERLDWMPDGHGGQKEYLCKKVYRLMFGEQGVQQLIQLGFLRSAQRVIPEERTPNREASRFVTVEQIVDEGRVDDTFCFTENKRGMGVFNGVLTGQCSEITLPTNYERTAVCCLSSVNLEEYDSWSQEPHFIPDLVEMLDNVLTHFIENAPPELKKAAYSAARERSIGLGAMGFHAYLQRHHIPFESVIAKVTNKRIFKYIKSEAKKATEHLAEVRGPCPDAGTHMVRNAHLLAIAPNASSSIICGNTSPSIEPYRANAFTQKTKSGSSLLKNEYLEHTLQELGMDTPEVWKSIMTNNGSVQHLDFLDEQTKLVFKTAPEMDQRWLVELAADRQQEICQSQSLNLFFPANVSKQELHAVHMMAWKKKVKTLYYLRSEAYRRVENISDEVLRQQIFESMDEDSCISCQG